MKTTLATIANVLDGKRLASFAADLASKGDIDPLDGLSKGKVYLYSGKDDIVVDTKVVATARDFYAEAGVPSQQIVFISDKEGGHAFLSDTAGNACSANKSPFIDRCPYDQAGAILSHIYGGLYPRGKADAASFVSFDQSPYAGKDANLAAQGVAYIPKTCRTIAVAKFMSSFTAALSPRTTSATPSPTKQASPIGRRPTTSLCCSRKRRRLRSIQ